MSLIGGSSSNGTKTYAKAETLMQQRFHKSIVTPAYEWACTKNQGFQRQSSRKSG
jgi:hypothetical protein